MALLEPSNNNNDKTPKYSMDYFPQEQVKHLTMEQQFQLRSWMNQLQNASREQLYHVAVDAMCLVYGTRNMTKKLAKEKLG